MTNSERTPQCGDGFLNIMFKILDEEKPDYLTVAFDRSEPTFRHQMFDAYKDEKTDGAGICGAGACYEGSLQAWESKNHGNAGIKQMICLERLQIWQNRGKWMSALVPYHDLLQLATEKSQFENKTNSPEIEDHERQIVVERYWGWTKGNLSIIKALMG